MDEDDEFSGGGFRFGGGDPFSFIRGAHSQGTRKSKQDPPIEKNLPFTLEELFHGSSKKMKISKKVNLSS